MTGKDRSAGGHCPQNHEQEGREMALLHMAAGSSWSPALITRIRGKQTLVLQFCPTRHFTFIPFLSSVSFSLHLYPPNTSLCMHICFLRVVFRPYQLSARIQSLHISSVSSFAVQPISGFPPLVSVVGGSCKRSEFTTFSAAAVRILYAFSLSSSI